MFEGSYATSTVSAWPVRPEQTSSYVGLGVYPPEYPAAVEITPGVCQNFFSAPQKQPRPNTAVRVPSGHGPVSDAPFTKWRAGATMGSDRPLRASSGLGMDAFRPNRNMPLLYARGRAARCRASVRRT